MSTELLHSELEQWTVDTSGLTLTLILTLKSELQSVSVVVVVTERQAERPHSVVPSNKHWWRSRTVHSDKIEDFGRKVAPDEYPPSLMVDND